MHITPLSNVLLICIALIILIRLLYELHRRYHRAKKRKNVIARIHKEWIEHAQAFAEWRIKNKFENFEHPHHQWYVRKEVEIFQALLYVKKDSATRRDQSYLAELRWQIQPNLPVEEPPKE